MKRTESCMSQETRVLVFDMDGTLANLYSVENWLPMLRAFDPTPYAEAEPMYDMMVMRNVVLELQRRGWYIVITTALAKVSNPEYDRVVTEAKLAWLDRYQFPYDEFHAVPYTAKKEDSTKELGGRQILVDDNPEVRSSWTIGETIDATGNILVPLSELLAG